VSAPHGCDGTQGIGVDVQVRGRGGALNEGLANRVRQREGPLADGRLRQDAVHQMSRGVAMRRPPKEVKKHP
jgi:hypothetical protein